MRGIAAPESMGEVRSAGLCCSGRNRCAMVHSSPHFNGDIHASGSGAGPDGG